MAIAAVLAFAGFIAVGMAPASAASGYRGLYRYYYFDSTHRIGAYFRFYWSNMYDEGRPYYSSMWTELYSGGSWQTLRFCAGQDLVLTDAYHSPGYFYRIDTHTEYNASYASLQNSSTFNYDSTADAHTSMTAAYKWGGGSCAAPYNTDRTLTVTSYDFN
jgi:hypothetical protein